MRLFFIAINRPCCLAWNIAVMFGLVFQITSLMHWTSCRNRYRELLALLLLLLKNYWPIVRLWPIWICFLVLIWKMFIKTYWIGPASVFSWKLFFILKSCMIFLSPFLDVIRMIDILKTANSFFRCTARLRNYLSTQCFSLAQELKSFRFRVPFSFLLFNGPPFQKFFFFFSKTPCPCCGLSVW